MTKESLNASPITQRAIFILGGKVSKNSLTSSQPLAEQLTFESRECCDVICTFITVTLVWEAKHMKKEWMPRPVGSCVEYLIPTWCRCVGKWLTLWGTRLWWRKKVTRSKWWEVITCLQLVPFPPPSCLPWSEQILTHDPAAVMLSQSMWEYAQTEALKSGAKADPPSSYLGCVAYFVTVMMNLIERMPYAIK